MGIRFVDIDSSYVLTDGDGDKPRKTKAMVHMTGFIWGFGGSWNISRGLRRREKYSESGIRQG